MRETCATFARPAAGGRRGVERSLLTRNLREVSLLDHYDMRSYWQG